jgi:hypothetical protein
MDTLRPARTCSIDGCEKLARARGLCTAHYTASLRSGELTRREYNRVRKPCAVDGCETPTTRTYCSAHETQLRRYGAGSLKPLIKYDRASKPCSVEGCDSLTTGTYCKVHERRFRRYGDATFEPVRKYPRKPCAVDGCQSLTTRTYCNAHEARLRRYGDATFKRPKANQGVCSEAGCGRPARVGGLCGSHYSRSRRLDADRSNLPVMLDDEEIQFIRQHREWSREKLALTLNTDVHTIIAVQAGRNWGRTLSTERAKLLHSSDPGKSPDSG